jgi:hypothetical protein
LVITGADTVFMAATDTTADALTGADIATGTKLQGPFAFGGLPSIAAFVFATPEGKL